jgi:putative ABC transport system permease protein
MRLRTCSVREVQRRPGRTLLTLLGITLGLATLVAVRLSLRTLSRTYRDLFAFSGDHALEVTAPSRSGFDPRPLAGLASAAGVREVVPRIQGAVALSGPSGGVTVVLVGIDPGRESDTWPLRQGHAPSSDEEALLDAGLADTLGLVPGQPLKLWSAMGPCQLSLGGTLRPTGATAGTGGLLIVSLNTARRLLGLGPGQVNCLCLRLDDGTDPEQVRKRLSGRLPANLLLQEPGAQGGLAHSTLLATEQGLSALSALALVTAAFVILNTFLLNLGERRRPLALLKTLGATRWQILRLILGEALLLGLIGAVLGGAVGTGLAVLLLEAMGRFLGIGLPELQLTAEPYFLAGLLGAVIPILAASVPAWQAARRPALEVLLPRRNRTPSSCPLPGADRGRRSVSWGLLLLVLGLVPAAGLWNGWLPGPVGRDLLAPTLGLLLAGTVLSFPLLLPPVLSLLGKLPLGLTGNLALGQLIRHRTRTGLTAGVLFLTVAVAVSFGLSLRGLLADLRDWYRRTIVADFLVRASMPDSSFLLASALPENLGDELARLDGVSSVDRIAFLPATSHGRSVLVLARTFPARGPLPLDLREGTVEQVRDGLRRGEAVLGVGLAAQAGLHAGDVFDLDTPHGPVQLRIAGTAAEFAGGGAALYLDWHAVRHLLDIPGTHVFLVSALPGRVADARVALRGYCTRRGLLLQTNEDLRDLIARLLTRVTGAIGALLVLVFGVASLGIVNTLQMNVRDQAREFGVLRALGLRQRQVWSVVMAQALFLGAVSLPAGLLAGMGLALLISEGSAVWAQVPIPFRLDAVVLLGSCGVALASVVLSAVLPAREAARQPVIRALG